MDSGTRWPPCRQLGLSVDPDVLLMLVASLLQVRSPRSLLRGWGRLPRPLVPAPLGEAKCCFAQSGLHGNRPDLVNPASRASSKPGLWKPLGSQLR